MDEASTPPPGTDDHGAAAPRRHYLVLDGLRGVAAIAVFAHHGRGWLPQTVSFQRGYLAVDFFFMLSGFVLAHAYGERLGQGRLPFLRFVQLRAIRLYPLVVLGTTLGLLPAIWAVMRHISDDNSHLSNETSIGHVLAAYPFNALAMPVWGYGQWHYPLNGPVWSLGCEIAINLAYAILARWLSTRLLACIAALSLAVLARWSIHYGAVMEIGPFFGPSLAIVARTTFPFTVGVLMQRLHAAGRLPAPRLGLGILTVLLCASFLPPRQILGSFVASAVYDMLCIAALYPTIIASACAMRSAGPWDAAARIGADLSFPLYALHFPFVDWFTLIVPPLHLRHRYMGACYVLLMVAVIAASWWAAKLDAAVRRKLTRWASRPGARLGLAGQAGDGPRLQTEAP